MSDIYLPPKSRVQNPRDRVMVAQCNGWQVQHDAQSKARGLRFKLTDMRAPAHRIAEVGGTEAPDRRVWNIVYNPGIDYFGGDDGMLRDFYPSVAIWMHGEIRHYAKSAGLTIGKQRGVKARDAD